MRLSQSCHLDQSTLVLQGGGVEHECLVSVVQSSMNVNPWRHEQHDSLVGAGFS